MPKANEELRNEIQHHMEASVALGKNVRSVQLDQEHFVEAVLDVMLLERMKMWSRMKNDTQKLHFQVGMEHEREKVLEYLGNLQAKQPQDRAEFLRAIINEIGEGKHLGACR